MRIALVALNDNFVGPVKRELEKYHVVKRYAQTDSIAWNLMTLQSLLDWCDVAFFDFVFPPLPEATHLPILKCKIVARLHGLEIFHQLPRVDWEKVNYLICSLPQAKRLKTTDIPTEVVVLPIGTNPDFFQPLNKKKYGRNICVVGNIVPWKRIYSTVQTIAPLLKKGWKFTLSGDRTSGFRKDLRTEYKVQIKELSQILEVEDRIIYNRFLPSEAYARWLAVQDIIISNSTMEGYHKSIFDAMACGVYPLVNCWLGAEDLFPEECIFYSQSGLLKKIKKWDKKSLADKVELSDTMRKYIVDCHDERKVAIKIRKVIEGA